MSAHPVTWQAPQPLWHRFADGAAASARKDEQSRPAILRFADDRFMEQLIALLGRDPAQLGAHIAAHETWRSPAAEPASLLTQTPLPPRVQAAVRTSAAARPKSILAVAPPTDDKPLKLYQPAHQRHYLVSASLVCATPGLPDRAVEPGGGEPVHFVLRRMLPDPGNPTSLAEYAYVTDAAGTRWQRVGRDAEARRVVAGEEALPLFALAFSDDAGKPRRLWTGSVPVGRREEYLGAEVRRSTAPLLAAGQVQAASLGTAAATAGTGTHKLGRVTQFQMEVAEPWKNMIRSSHLATASIDEIPEADGGPESDAAKLRRVQDFDLQQQDVSWLVLLDFADFLAAHFEALWAVIEADGAGVDSLPPLEQDLHAALRDAKVSTDLADALQSVSTETAARPVSTSLRAALVAVRASGVREGLERQPLHYDRTSVASADWPGFHFLLAGIDNTLQATGPYASLLALPASAIEEAPSEAMPADQASSAGNADAALIDRLTALVGLALPDEGDAKAPPLPFALTLKNRLFNGLATDPGQFVLRFVHQRLACGPLHPPRVSAPSETFQLASFFDSDAPARPIRITLPADTSPAGLRKFNRNTAFVLSDMLCGQVQRAKSLGLVDLVRAVLPWPLHKDLSAGSGSCKSGGLDVGMICSLSIPIITICALILLIIIVTLLDLVFRWLPFFIMCFPLPGLKGKR